jgi:hypothetical protein
MVRRDWAFATAGAAMMSCLISVVAVWRTDVIGEEERKAVYGVSLYSEQLKQMMTILTDVWALEVAMRQFSHTDGPAALLPDYRGRAAQILPLALSVVKDGLPAQSVVPPFFTPRILDAVAAAGEIAVRADVRLDRQSDAFPERDGGKDSATGKDLKSLLLEWRDKLGAAHIGLAACVGNVLRDRTRAVVQSDENLCRWGIGESCGVRQGTGRGVR